MERRSLKRVGALLALLLLLGCGDYSGTAAESGTPDDSGGTPVETDGGGNDAGDDETPASGDDGGGSSNVDLVNGKSLYDAQCRSCHGAQGNGGVGPALNNSTSCPSCASHDTLWVEIRDTMPQQSPSSCDEGCARDVASYIMNNFSTVDAGGSDDGAGDGDGGIGGDDDPVDDSDDGSGDEGGVGSCETDPDTETEEEPAPTEPAEATCAVEFVYRTIWTDGFTADIKISNFSGAEVDGWTLRWTFANGERATQWWSSELSQNGTAVEARPVSYNGRISDNGSVEFGFNGAHSGTAEVPLDLTLEAEGCFLEAGAGGGGSGSSGDDSESPLPCGERPPTPRLLRLQTRWEYERTVAALTGLSGDFAGNFPVEARVIGYDNNAKVAVVTDRHVDEYLTAAEDIAARAVAERRAALLPCDPDSNANCAREFVESFGRRAFRRPLSHQEITQFTDLFDSEISPSFDQGMALAIGAMLSSPAFLYRSEVGNDIGDGAYRLGDYEIASSLSYLLWGSMPDDELLQAAADGALREAAGRLAQAERMLGDERARERFADFAEQWLRTSYLLGSFKDPEIFPALSDEVRRAMVEELSRFVNHVALDSTDGTLDELYTADYVFVNGPLREYYGLPGSNSDTAFSMELAGTTRGGIVALGAVLASHAHSNESSPIKRGVFVRERLLCQELPDPPPDVDTTPPGLDPNLTTRERFAQHTDDPNCASCHQYIDGTGFGLERYDGAGGYRTTENGQLIDDSGELVDREGFNTGTSDGFAGPRQLAQVLATTEAARACAVKQYYRYAYGYAETSADSQALARQQQRFADEGYTLRSLITNLIAADEFILRRDGSGS